LLAGRKIGQVDKLFSPVSKEEAAKAEAAAEALHSGDPSPTPADKPKYEARIDVKVDKNALVYKDARTRLITLGLLGEVAIDITQGNDTSGRASDGEIFAGERVPDFGESISKMLDIVKPVAAEATNTLKELQTTAQNLSRITDESSQLNMGLAQFRTFVENLTSLTSRDSSLSVALKNVEKISTDLSSNDNIQITLQNFRDSSDKLKGILNDLNQLGPDLKASGTNIKELTETVKTQPWRLVWPSTKKYPQDEAAVQPTPAKKTTKPKPRPTATPPPRTR
jgi:ABC-type transporter Mla subunit MlaD